MILKVLVFQGLTKSLKNLKKLRKAYLKISVALIPGVEAEYYLFYLFTPEQRH